MIDDADVTPKESENDDSNAEVTDPKDQDEHNGTGTTAEVPEKTTSEISTGEQNIDNRHT